MEDRTRQAEAERAVLDGLASRPAGPRGMNQLGLRLPGSCLRTDDTFPLGRLCGLSYVGGQQVSMASVKAHADHAEA